ncbi:MAG: sigma-70 family RNA polymerase sigma factor [Clostridia bacterium]|nr:sigma-70 family RNA polymerase sigma factor [Clostridia bacterium]
MSEKTPAPPMVGARARNEKFKDNLTLILASQAGDARATDRLVRQNGGLVNHIAFRFLGRGQELEDLVQIGNIGLLKAIRTFDPARECAFSTYAVPLIFGEIRRFLRDDGPIKVSRSQKRLGAALAAEQERCIAAGKTDVHLSELAERCGVSVEEAASALDAIAPVSSLSDVLYNDEDSPTLESTLSDTDAQERDFDRLAISMAIDKLPELRRKIVLLRYYRDYSQSETAAALGLTQVKVSREEKKILAFLREELSESI